ncbi:hypothetical protein QBC32DRAFT_318601 [Pseudoneurospora amorphoporcata]|uniref:Uncharacterized protein n=1 Tax=Pseudoneurospora amorphoporcata TaxID=241081 RepID=A0AAN6NKQ2_9PEZI|nr:hypothetical protein QBC32DRAFT_318601 [Pseudoneurospora amorphoporcata]
MDTDSATLRRVYQEALRRRSPPPERLAAEINNRQAPVPVAPMERANIDPVAYNPHLPGWQTTHLRGSLPLQERANLASMLPGWIHGNAPSRRQPTTREMQSWRAPAAPMERADSDQLVGNLSSRHTSHLSAGDSLSYRERDYLASDRLISGHARPRQRPAAEVSRGALYDPIRNREVVLPPPEPSPVAAVPTRSSTSRLTWPNNGNLAAAIKTRMGAIPTLSEPGSRNMASNNTQFAAPNARKGIDIYTSSDLEIRLEVSRGHQAPASHQTSVTAVGPDRYQNHNQERAPLPQTPLSQRATHVQPLNAPRRSLLPRIVSRVDAPVMDSFMALQGTLLHPSNREVHEQVHEAASYGFPTMLQQFFPPSEGRGRAPKMKTHNRGGARDNAGRKSNESKKLTSKQTESAPISTTSDFARRALMKLTSAIGSTGGASHTASVSGREIQPLSFPSESAIPGGKGSGPGRASDSGPKPIPGPNSGLASISFPDPHGQSSNFPSASAGHSGLSGTRPTKTKRCKADGANFHSVGENSSGSVAASVSGLQLLALAALEALEAEKGRDEEGEKGEDASSSNKKGEKRKEKIVQHKAAGKDTKSCEKPEEENIPRVQSQSLCGGKRKYKAITAEATGKAVAEELAKDERPAQWTRTATMSSSAVLEALARLETPVRPVAP